MATRKIYEYVLRNNDGQIGNVAKSKLGFKIPNIIMGAYIWNGSAGIERRSRPCVLVLASCALALIRFLPTFRLARSLHHCSRAHFSHVGTIDFFVLYPQLIHLQPPLSPHVVPNYGFVVQVYLCYGRGHCVIWGLGIVWWCDVLRGKLSDDQIECLDLPVR